MTKKSQKAYEAVFDFIDAKIVSLKGTKRFYTDYEKAMRNALKKKYRKSKQTACHFHFTQAVRRKAMKLSGFMEFFQQNENARKIYYKLLYLPLLPAKHIITVFNTLRRQANSFDRCKFEPFLAYYYQQWIINEGPKKISVFGNEIRTTSAAEGYNRVLNAYCHKKGNFIWFCVSIRNQEFMKSKEMHSFVESGGIIGCNRKRDDEVSMILQNIFHFSDEMVNINVVYLFQTGTFRSYSKELYNVE